MLFGGLGPVILVHAVLLQLFAKRATVDSHHDGSAGLIAAGVSHNFFQQRGLNFGQYHFVQIIDVGVVQLLQVFVNRLLY